MAVELSASIGSTSQATWPLKMGVADSVVGLIDSVLARSCWVVVSRSSGISTRLTVQLSLRRPPMPVWRRCSSRMAESSVVLGGLPAARSLPWLPEWNNATPSANWTLPTSRLTHSRLSVWSWAFFLSRSASRKAPRSSLIIITGVSPNSSP